MPPTKFKSEAERLAALNALPEAPPPDCPDVDAWQAEQDRITDELANAPIDPSYTPAADTPSQGSSAADGKNDRGQDAGGSQGGYKAEDWTFQAGGQTITIPENELPRDPHFTFKNAKDALLGVVHTQRYLETKQREHAREREDLNSRLKELEKSNQEMKERLEKSTQAPAQGGTAAAAAAAPSDADITQLQTEYDTLDQQIQELEETDPDQAVKLIRRSQRLRDKITDLRLEKELAKRDAQIRSYKEADEAKTKEQKEREAKEAKEKELAEARTREFSEIDSFSTAVPDLKLSQSYAAVEKEVYNWGAEVAAIDATKPVTQVTWKDVEVALDKYLKKSPRLMDALDAAGLVKREPKEMRKYLLLSEIHLYRKGRTLDPVTGLWKQHDFRHPDLDSAYYHWKRDRGYRTKEILDAERRGAAEVLDAMNVRGAAEIPSDMGQRRDNAKAMTAKEALELATQYEDMARKAGMTLEDFIGEKERINPDDPLVRKYDELIAVLESSR